MRIANHLQTTLETSISPDLINSRANRRNENHTEACPKSPISLAQVDGVMRPSIETDIRLIRYNQNTQTYLDTKAGEEVNLIVPRLSSSPIVNDTPVPVNTITDDVEQNDSYDLRDTKIGKGYETPKDIASLVKSSVTGDRLDSNKQAEEESKVTIISNFTAEDRSITGSTDNSKRPSVTERADEKVIRSLHF